MSAERLADLPNAEGLAAVFAGTSGDALLVAGGTNFPDKKPWEGGTKHWHDEIYVLDSPDGQWKTGFRLPRPLAHGASVSTSEGLICIGGGDADRAFTDVFMLIWQDNKLQRRDLPALPQPVCSAAAALVGQTIYLAGGSSSTDPLGSESLHQLLALDLSAAQPKWRQLAPWPGPGRYFPVAASHGGKFYLFTGMRRASDEQGRRKIEFLTDAYCYTPGGDDSPEHWRRLADLPVAKAAAPTPAVAIDEHRLVILGGGVAPEDIVMPMPHRRELSRTVLAYDVAADRWQQLGEVPAPRCAATAVQWRRGAVVPSGEVQGGIRSPQVWFYRWADQSR